MNDCMHQYKEEMDFNQDRNLHNESNHLSQGGQRNDHVTNNLTGNKNMHLHHPTCIGLPR